MWNVIASNRPQSCSLKSKHQSQTIQVPRDTLYSKKVQVITDLKGKQTESDKKSAIELQNQKLLERIRKMRAQKPAFRSAVPAVTSEQLRINRQRANSAKQIQLNQQNQRIMKKLISTSSSLKKFRMTSQQKQWSKTRLPKQHKKSILALSEYKNGLNLKRKMQTEGAVAAESRLETSGDIPLQIEETQ